MGHTKGSVRKKEQEARKKKDSKAERLEVIWGQAKNVIYGFMHRRSKQKVGVRDK